MKNGWNVKAWLAAGLAALVAGSAWAQRTAPVNPAAARWQRERAAKAAEVRPKALRPAAVRGTTGGEDEDFGFVPELLDTGYLSDLNANLVQGVGDELPSRYDLREQSAVTPVRDQGDYGTCWAFAAMGALESWIAKSEGLATDWSENHLANRHGWNLDFAAGGNAQMVQGYLLRWAGPVAESADAYPRPGESPADAVPGRHVQRVLWLPGKTAALDHDGLKAALMAHGALYVSYYHAAGYYNPSTAAYCFPAGGAKSPLSNHAVALVGWDDAYPRENFKIPPPGDGAYLVKNSWGGDWGDGGYFHVSYHDAFFARSTVYAFADAEETGNYDAVYGHDPLGMVGSVGFNAPSAWGANVFTAATASKIAAAGFYAMVPRTTYTLRVYTGCSKNAPRSGTLASEQSGTVDEAGYVTIPLASPADVAEGERFSVVLHLTTPGYPYPLASEYAVPGFTSAASAGAGESFLSLDGVSWHDFTKRIDSTANFCCKAYAKAEVAARELSALAISGVNSLKAGGTALFTCEAVYSDGTRQAVSPVWDIAEGADWASVAADGTVTANPVTSQQTVTLRATYAEAGATATATWKFLVTVGAPAAPAGLAATEGTEETCVRLSWEAAPAASSYAVYRGVREDSARAGYLGTVTATRYADASAVPGVDYRYFVKAKNDSGSSPFGVGAWGWRALSAPAALAASDGLEASVELSWNAAEGASAYRVFRSEDPLADDPAPLGSWQAECRFSDTAAEAGTVYFYSVAAAIDAEGTRAGARCLPVEGRRTGPVALQSLEIAGPASLASGASGTYHCTALYTDGSAVGVAPEWSVSSGTLLSDGADAVVTAPIVAENGSLTLSAAFTEDGVSCTARFDIRLVPVVPAAPEGLSVQAATAEGGISLAWSPVPGASGYLVSRGTAADSLEAIATVASPAHADATAVPGIACWYGVSAVNAAGTGPMAGPVQAVRPVAAPTGVEAGYGTDRDAVHVAWQSVLGATRYRVHRTAADSAAAPTPISGWIDVLAFDDTTAEPGLEYLYSVQAAADADGFAAGPLGGPTTGMRAITPRPVSLSIRGPAAVAAGESAVYVARACWNDGTEGTVTPVWSLSGADGLASVSADGTLSVDEGIATDATTSLHASYTDAGATVSASLLVQLRAPTAPVASLSAVSSRTRWPWNGWIDIDYTLETSPEGTLAAIALAATDLDHRVPLLPSTLEGVGADGLPVAAGSHRLSWNLAADYPDFHAKDFKLSLTATPADPIPTNAHPRFLVVDLSGGTAASSWPVSYLDAEPAGGFNTDEYKTTKLVLRRIEAGTFTMGSPTNELGRGNNETAHEVTLSKAFWMGLFEVTQDQWTLAMGGNPSENTGGMRPVERVSYNDVRGSSPAWPDSADVAGASFMGVLRAKTGLAFDLPTEAQWEYACRAGTTTALNSGKDLSGTGACTNAAEVARYPYNSGNNGTCDGKGGYDYAHTTVGSYLPNAWGLYDMHGNVEEWCLDRYTDELGADPQTDPVGPSSGGNRLLRGGSWCFVGAGAIRSAYRGRNPASYANGTIGLRVACAAPKVQQLDFPAIGTQVATNRVELSATASGGGEVVFAVLSGPGFLDGSTLCFTGAGTVVVQASQAGDDEWAAASAKQEVEVVKAVQEVAFTEIPGQIATNRVVLSASATSGGKVSFAVVSGPGFLSGNVLSFTGSGTVVLSATQAGNNVWEAASATREIAVSKAAQTVRFPAIPALLATNRVDLSVAATATSGGEIAFSVVSGPGYLTGSILGFTGEGTVVVRAAQAGNDIWEAAEATRDVIVFKVDQTLDFPEIGTLPRTAVVTLSATATSGGEIDFAVVSGPGVINGATLSFTDAGWVTISATQAGNEIWESVTETQDVEVEDVLAPASFIVVDMSSGPAAASWPVEYLDAEPDGGFNTAEYKTAKLVLRHIEPGTFTMGSPDGELGRYAGIEDLHEVTLTCGFYAGVFEVTQKQWELAMGSNPSEFPGDMRPVERVSYGMVRGTGSDAAWPGATGVDPDSFLGVLRAKTGVTFDLPTEAQWEYACRAGTTTALNSGENLTSESSCPNLAALARYPYNSGSMAACDGKGGYDYAHTTVGSYLPNAWGLYDMHGNVEEWCLDWYTPSLGTGSATDPAGPRSGEYRLLRGGSWNYIGAKCCRSAYRGRNPVRYGNGTIGLRLVCPVGDNHKGGDMYYYVNDLLATNDIYCTAAGDDSNDGLTPATPKASIQAILDAYKLAPDDVVLVDAGQYVLTSPIVIGQTDSGELDEYGKPGYVTIQGSADPAAPTEILTRSRTFECVISLSDAEYIRLKDLTVRNAATGIILSHAVGCRLENVVSRDNNNSGVDVGDFCEDIVLRNSILWNNLSRTGGIAVAVGQADVHLDGCVLWGSPVSVQIGQGMVSMTNSVAYANGSSGRVFMFGESSTPESFTGDYNCYYVANGALLAENPNLTGGTEFCNTMPVWSETSGGDRHSMMVDSNPGFADPDKGDFHLVSRIGYYPNWCPNPDCMNSVLIDAGCPDSDWTNEPFPNGFVVNIGAYGNTAQASLSETGKWVRAVSYDGGGTMSSDILLTWNYGGMSPDTLVQLAYSIDYEETWKTIVSDIPVGQKEYEWDVSQLPLCLALKWRIQVQDEREIWDATDNYTTVKNHTYDYYINDSSVAGDLYCTAPGASWFDGATGTNAASPLDSLSDLLAIYPVGAGDRIFIDTGEYPVTEAIRFTDRQMGAQGMPLEIIGSTNWVAGGAHFTGYAGKHDGFQLVNIRHVAISNLRLSNMRNGLVLNCADEITLRDIETFENRGDGISASSCGSVVIANSLLVGNGKYGYESEGQKGSNSVLNATIWGNASGAVRVAQGSLQLGNSIVVQTNPAPACFIDGTSSVCGDYNLFSIPDGGVLATNSSLQTAYANLSQWADAENNVHSLEGDPLFADPENGDFHLQSRTGRWKDGLWVTDANTSMAIDAGNPSTLFVAEPAPNGGLVNLGRYGGTPMASKSDGNLRLVCPVEP